MVSEGQAVHCALSRSAVLDSETVETDDAQPTPERLNGTSCRKATCGNPLIRKLENLTPLSAEDRSLLEQLSSRTRPVRARTDLIREGDSPQGAFLVMEGIACRYKLRAGGGRQIMAYLLPGDFCDLDFALLNEMDHSIGALSACQVVQISAETVQDVLLNHPAIARALRLSTLVDQATLREWLVNIGRRFAEERLAHLLCELMTRLAAVGRVSEDAYDLPLTQVDLADTVGLTSVHVNRTLKVLRKEGLIAMTGRRVRILDLPRLQALAEFKANYLHLAGKAA